MKLHNEDKSSSMEPALEVDSVVLLMKSKRLTFNMQMSDARDLSSRVAHDALVDAGVSRPYTEHH